MPGDFIFWTKTNSHCGCWNEIQHVGIYIENGRCKQWGRPGCHERNLRKEQLRSVYVCKTKIMEEI